MTKLLVTMKFLLILIAAQTLAAMAQLPEDRFRVPVNNANVACVFNSTTCYAPNKYHTAIDYTSSNLDILAAAPGKVVRIVPDDTSNTNRDHNMGNTVVLEHKIINVNGGIQPLYSQYSHLKSFIIGLYEGQSVIKGQKIGTMGKTGGNWGVHLHFEIKTHSNIGSDPSGYWGYTPSSASGYGYIDPDWLIRSNTYSIGNDYAFWKFDGNGNLENWSLINIEGWSVNNGILFDNPQAFDPYIVSPDINVDASVLKYVNLRIANNGLDGNLSVYFKTSEQNYWSEDKRFDFPIASSPLSGNAPFYNYSIPVYQNSNWRSRITAIRIDPTTTGANGTNADTIGFDSIRIAPNSTLY